MDMPPPGMARNSGPDHDQTLDQPVYGAFHFFAPDVERPDHMQEVAGQNPHLPPGRVSVEALTAGFVPAQGVFAILDPIFHIPAAVIDLDHLAGLEPVVGEHKAEPGEQLAPVPLDLGHHPASPAPTLGLVLEINDLDLKPLWGGRPGGWFR
jgi:hypothetical protein